MPCHLFIQRVPLMNLSSREEESPFMLKHHEKQGSFCDADYICEQLIPQDNFYRKLRKIQLRAMGGDGHHA